ncbi:MAG TPA: metalloregulator ArsR/SmtB family transcription factor [Chloroflexota bacterium]|nr:metalloregulator ArsR/SmtB family transcription factor [Chloroflexota bacterium]
MTRTSAQHLDNPERVARAAQAVDYDKLATMQERLRLVRATLCEPVRLKIVQALSTGALSVSDLAVAIESARPATSQHLRVLRDLGIVAGERRGTTVYYRLCADWQARYLQQVLRSVEDASA